MKMVKSLLLGSAAGLVAIAGAQAADLPVKAKPVQYVKICSLYGVGFYYIPGTDMCLKIGGWVRAEYAYGANGSIDVGPSTATRITVATNNSTWRARGYITADARNQTAYGTVRAYIAVGLNSNDDAGTRRAATRSAPTAPSSSGRASRSVWRSRSTTSTAGRRRPYWGDYPERPTPAIRAGTLLAYTAQFGNGFSATISRRRRAAGRRSSASMTRRGSDRRCGGSGCVPAGTLSAARPRRRPGAYGGLQAPDVVGNLRVDQAWGSAQVMAAWHDVNAGLLRRRGRAANAVVWSSRATNRAGRSAAASS